MPRQYIWFITYIFRKKYLSVHLITMLISYPQKSVLLSIYFHNVCKKTLCGFSMGSIQYWAGRVYKLCVYFITGTPEGSTESDFFEKPGIEPTTSEVSHMRRFKSFAACLSDKDYKFMSWVT